MIVENQLRLQKETSYGRREKLRKKRERRDRKERRQGRKNGWNEWFCTLQPHREVSGIQLSDGVLTRHVEGPEFNPQHLGD